MPTIPPKRDAVLRYDENERVVDVTMCVHFTSREQIDAHFRRVNEFIRRHRRQGEHLYIIIGYDDYRCEPDLVPLYAEKVKEASGDATVVRYGGDTASRTTTRLVSMKAHTPSNLYGTRDEALAVVRRLRSA